MTTPPTTLSTPLTHAPWPLYADDELQAVLAVLRSGKVNYWTGSEAREFEREYAEYFGARRAIALANGSLALELALQALGIGAGDEVLVTPRTFIASASAVVLRGATPVFCDVDRESGNMTAETIAPLITKRSKAIIAVHLGGWPCDMDAIRDLAHSQELWVIEDCAQSHGARYHGRYAGSLGDIAAWSFCQDKILSTGGEGGMVTTDHEEWWDNMWSYKDHGKSWEAVYEREHAPGFRWLHESFGSNWRMTEMQAAIGRRQLAKLEGWVAARTRNASILRAELAPLAALRIPVPADTIRHAYYRFYVYVRPEALKSDWSRDRLQAEFAARGIPCNSGSCSEVYREKAFTNAHLAPLAPLPIAKELGETSLAFLVHPTLSVTEMAAVAEQAAAVVREATK